MPPLVIWLSQFSGSPPTSSRWSLMVLPLRPCPPFCVQVVWVCAFFVQVQLNDTLPGFFSQIRRPGFVLEAPMHSSFKVWTALVQDGTSRALVTVPSNLVQRWCGAEETRRIEEDALPLSEACGRRGGVRPRLVSRGTSSRSDARPAAVPVAVLDSNDESDAEAAATSAAAAASSAAARRARRPPRCTSRGVGCCRFSDRPVVRVVASVRLPQRR